MGMQARLRREKRANCYQDNLKQKRAFVQLEQLMQIKFKVMELQ